MIINSAQNVALLKENDWQTEPVTALQLKGKNNSALITTIEIKLQTRGMNQTKFNKRFK